ncbi:MAG: pyridoxamine 5'-phosphate oxidase family protein [Pseudomonadales bacterium]
MQKVSAAEKAGFFAAVDAASKKAVWCAIATVCGEEPRVRIVHPTWDGDVLWFATGPDSPKAQQLEENPNVDIQYQVEPPEFVHVMVRGTAELVTDPALKRHAWEAIDYDLTQFGSTGPEDPNFLPVRITPTRVELSEMFGSMNKRVWRA